MLIFAVQMGLDACAITDQDQAQIGVLLKRVERPRDRGLRTVVSPHSVYRDRDSHENFPGRAGDADSLLVVGVDLHHLLAPVVAGGRDVVAAMQLSRGRIGGQGGLAQGVVGTSHPSFRRRFTILLYGHDCP